jgi:hypothetical protein
MGAVTGSFCSSQASASWAHRDPTFFRYFRQPVDTLSGPAPAVAAYTDWLPMSSIFARGVATPHSRASLPDASGAPRDHADFFFPAERQHLPLLLPVHQAVKILHGCETWSTRFSTAIWFAFRNSHAYMEEAPMYRAFPASTTSCNASIVTSMGVV